MGRAHNVSRMTISKLMSRKDKLITRFLREASPPSALSKSVRSLHRALGRAMPRPHTESRTCVQANESAEPGWTVGNVIDAALETLPRQLSEEELWAYNVVE